jgi:hypothetical protein
LPQKVFFLRRVFHGTKKIETQKRALSKTMEEEDDVFVEGEQSPKCATLVVLPGRSHRDVVINALRKVPSLGPQTVAVPGQAARITLFVGLDFSMYGVIVSMSSDPRVRMNNLPRLVRETTCSRLVLVNPGYTREDLRRRRVDLPEACTLYFVTDSEHMCTALGANQEVRGLLRPVFGEPPPSRNIEQMVADFGSPPPFPFRESEQPPPPQVWLVDDAAEEEEDVDAIVAQAERDFQELERREAAAAAAAAAAPSPFAGISIQGSSVIFLGPQPPSRRDVQNAVSRINGGYSAPRRAPPPPPRPHPNNRRSIAIARAEERRNRDQLSDLARRATAPDSSERVKEMVKPREEEAGIPAMTITAANNTCIICVSAHITTAVLPCRHMHFCYTCIAQWVDKTHNCPVCRGTVETAIQLIGPTDVNSESKKRTLDPVYANKLADELCKDAEEIRKRAKSENNTKQ